MWIKVSELGHYKVYSINKNVNWANVLNKTMSHNENYELFYFFFFFDILKLC